MADTKITGLTNFDSSNTPYWPPAPASDVIPIVDVSDTTMAGSGTTKKISINNLLSSSPTATGAFSVTGLVTAGSAAITGAATVGTTLGVTGVSTFAAGTALLPALTTTGDTNTGIFFPAADTFAVTTGGTERYRVDSSGNFGVGVSPSSKFHIDAGASGEYFRGAGNSGSARYLVITASTTTNAGDTHTINASSSSGVLAFAINGTERVRIDSSGNVGVGVTPIAWGSGFKYVQVGSGSALGTNGSVDRTDVAANWYYNSGDKYINATGKASLFNQSAGAFSFLQTNTASGGVGSAMTLTTAMTLDATGNLLVGVASANANGGVLQLKSGITFPATQVAASDANTLDYYEEGTFTPTIIGNTIAGVGVYVNQVGTYTKIGNQVTVWVNIEWSSHTGTGTQMYIGGLPFSLRTSTGYNAYAALGYINNIALTAGNFPLILAGSSDSFARFFQSPTGGGAATAVPMDTAGQVGFTLSYQA